MEEIFLTPKLKYDKWTLSHLGLTRGEKYRIVCYEEEGRVVVLNDEGIPSSYDKSWFEYIH